MSRLSATVLFLLVSLSAAFVVPKPSSSSSSSSSSASIKTTTSSALLDTEYGSATTFSYEHAKNAKLQAFQSMTHYQTLGARPTETRDQIKRRYLQKAKSSHPDALWVANPNDYAKDCATMEFQRIALAWSILGDHKLRREYDRELQRKVSVDVIATSASMSFHLLGQFFSLLLRVLEDCYQYQQGCGQSETTADEPQAATVTE